MTASLTLTPDARVGDIADRLPGAAEVFRRIHLKNVILSQRLAAA